VITNHENIFYSVYVCKVVHTYVSDFRCWQDLCVCVVEPCFRCIWTYSICNYFVI